MCYRGIRQSSIPGSILRQDGPWADRVGPTLIELLGYVFQFHRRRDPGLGRPEVACDLGEAVVYFPHGIPHTTCHPPLINNHPCCWHLDCVTTASHNSPYHSLGSGRDPTIHQQRLGLAGEALAAKWLSGMARSPTLLSKLLGINMGDPFTDSGPNINMADWVVEWNNESTESGLPYDIILHCRAFDRTIFIEVKTTTTWTNATIDVSMNHLDFARAHPHNYLILRVFAEEIETITTLPSSSSSSFLTGDNIQLDHSIVTTSPTTLSSDHNHFVMYRARRIVVINSVWDAIRTKAIQILLRL